MEEYKKKYEEALKRAKEIHAERRAQPFDVATRIFPELKESEDEENIMEAIIALIEFGLEDKSAIAPGYNVTKEQSIAWLENKCKQKLTNKVEPKFKVGDVMRTLQEAADGFTDGMPVVVSIDDTSYRCTNEIIYIKNQDNYEYPPINRRQNPSWSEEDENGLGDALWAVQQARTIAKDENEMGNLWYAENWLKSLKERYTWKPSDEQINALKFVMKGIEKDFLIYPILNSILEQLKKLK